MTTDEADLAALVVLAALPGVGPATLLACREQGAREAWEAVTARRTLRHPAMRAAVERARDAPTAAEIEAAAQGVDPEAVLASHRAAGILVVGHGDPGYPARLVDDPSPPALLFAAGSPDALDGPAVAIVGTRNATRLGCDTAAELATDLARCGMAIASGLALGIDGAAHRAIVELLSSPTTAADPCPGRPVAVVAAGLDHRYPRRHAGLHDAVATNGVVLSEVPFGVGPARWRFPARNRIIAGLCDALLVVESRSRGGSMLTVAEALARDVPVLAVPGHPSAPASAGTLDLICEGATPVRDAEDVLVAIGRGGALRSMQSSVDARRAEALEDDAVTGAVVAALESGPKTLAELVRASGCSLGDLSAAVVRLEQHGRLVRSGAWYERRGVASVARPSMGGRS